MHTSSVANAIMRTQALVGAPEDYIGYGPLESGYVESKMPAAVHYKKDGKYKMVMDYDPEYGIACCKRVLIGNEEEKDDKQFENEEDSKKLVKKINN